MRPRSPPHPISFGAIILAAGASSRMGRPKLLLPWGATSVLGYLLEQWQELKTEQIVVVCSARDEAIRTELNRLGFSATNLVFNRQPERGMFSSIQCAALWQGWNAALTHWAIVLGDQPHLRAETLRELLGFTAAHPERICQPMYGGHRRHPVLLPKAIFSLLATSTAGDLKQFLQPYQIAGCGVDDAGLELDIDWPEDYHRALQLSDKKNKTLRD